MQKITKAGSMLGIVQRMGGTVAAQRMVHRAIMEANEAGDLITNAWCESTHRRKGCFMIIAASALTEKSPGSYLSYVRAGEQLKGVGNNDIIAQHLAKELGISADDVHIAASLWDRFDNRERQEFYELFNRHIESLEQSDLVTQVLDPNRVRGVDDQERDAQTLLQKNKTPVTTFNVTAVFA